ncbi:MAG: hypothetical protein K2K39_00305 [Clostridia bacterium]|nr:hypothetical protein [Clostridia bacterium]
MDNKERNLTQKEIDEIFSVVNKLRRAKGRELTEKETEKLINKVRSLA